jgi:predicted DNA-binding transcriptional regulator YafY
MPKNKHAFGRYRLINRELRKKPFVKTKDLQKAINDELCINITVRQIQLDIEAMSSDPLLGYEAPIEYDKYNKAYKYTDRNYSINSFNLKDEEIIALKFHAASLNQYKEHGLFKDFSSVLQKVVEAVEVNSKINTNLHNQLIVQTDNYTPGKGGEYLSIIAEAIDRKVKIAFKYKKFDDKKSKEWRVHPYLLKEYKNRWYLICKSEISSQILTFALDRVSNVEKIDEICQIDKSFDPVKLFKYSFGITTLNDPPEVINLLFSPKQAKYVKSLPIHKSQKEIKETKKGLHVRIEVIPSYEFYEYILGQGANVKVLSPDKIKQKVKKFHKEALTGYSK